MEKSLNLTNGEAWQILQYAVYYGLFIVRLNNGDWMVGRANQIYHIDITQDHYSDPDLSISSDLREAVLMASQRVQVQDGAKI